MEIFESSKLVLFIIFAIPVFISIKTYSLLCPNHEKDSIFISNLYADMPGCIGSNLKEAEPNAERFHRYYAQSNR